MRGVILFLLIIFLSADVTSAEFRDKIVLVVDDEVVTQNEINEILAPIYIQYSSLYQDKELQQKLEDVRVGIMNRLIEDKLILGEAKRQGIEASKEEIGVMLEDIKARFPREEEFKEALVRQGVILQDLEERYREQILIKKLVEREVKAKIVVSPIEITAYYNGHIEGFREPLSVKVRHILVKVEDESKREESLKKAEQILAFLKVGDNFAELAREYSEGARAKEGGDLGFITKGEMMKEIDEVIFGLEEGEVSCIVKTNLGYHIFKVEKKRAERIKELTEVQTQIENILFQEKVKQRFKEWIEKLKKSAYIKIEK